MKFGDFKGWLKNKFIFIKNLLLTIKSRVLRSMKIEKDGVSFTFPKGFNETTNNSIVASLAGFAFEEECYLALSRSGLKDITKNFNYVKYKERREDIGEELYGQIKKDAEQFSKIMIAHAKEQMECIDLDRVSNTQKIKNKQLWVYSVLEGFLNL